MVNLEGEGTTVGSEHMRQEGEDSIEGGMLSNQIAL